MKILIKELAKSQWQVRLDQHTVTFRSEAEARAFTRTLEARLHALISFPTSSSARLVEPSSDLGLNQCPGILQTSGEHRHAHHQNSAQADDQGHRHGAAIV